MLRTELCSALLHVADGRKMCENKDVLLVRMRESEHHIAKLCSSSVIGEKLKSSSATVCPTEADSEYLVEKTASIFAETLEGDSMPDPVSLDDAFTQPGACRDSR